MLYNTGVTLKLNDNSCDTAYFSPQSGLVQLGVTMNKFTRYSATILSLFFSANAHAYLDPATGSIILQGIIAGVAGGLLTLKIFWGKITGFFSKNKDNPNDIEVEAEDSASADKFKSE